MMTFGANRALTMDDLSALRQYASSGDPQAFEVLAARYQSMVLAICRRTLGNEADAEDATQETFLRLARHASTIKSNAAAWLHSCALNASKDVLRRKGAGVQAVHTAQNSLDAVPDSGEPETARLWRDIEPLLDAALADLSDEDRDVIVARFLVGRPLGDLAKEAGIAAGTMSRRVDRALANLRQKLGPASLGFAGLGAGDALSAVLQHGAAGHAAGPALTASVAKIGLSGIGATVVTTSATRSVAALLMAATLGLGTIGVGGWYAMSMHGANATAFVAPSDPNEKFERPTADTKPVDLFTVSDNQLSYVHARFDRDTIDFTLSHDAQGKSQGLVLTVETLTQGKPGKGVDAKGSMTLRLKSYNVPENDEHLQVIKDELLQGTYEIRGERLKLLIKTPDRPDKFFQMDWSGRRHDEAKPVLPAIARPEQVAAYKQPPKAVFEKEPLLAGTWREQSPLQLKLSKNNIYMSFKGSGGEYGDRYRIIEWTAEAGQARVQAIVADSYDSSRVGRRLKMLLRKDATGYTTAMHAWDSPKLNEWPSGFDDKKDATLSVFVWQVEEAS